MEARYCGRCNGSDTMLVCCECLRELKEQDQKDLQEAYDISMKEINRLRKLLNYDS